MVYNRLQNIDTTLAILIWITFQLIGIESCQHPDIISKCLPVGWIQIQTQSMHVVVQGTNCGGRKHRDETGEGGDRGWLEAVSWREQHYSLMHCGIRHTQQHKTSYLISLAVSTSHHDWFYPPYLSCLYFSLSLHNFKSQLWWGDRQRMETQREEEWRTEQKGRRNSGRERH